MSVSAFVLALQASSGAPLGVRRMPETAPRVVRGEALIRTSASTNTPAYTIVVRPDFSARITQAGIDSSATIGKPQGKWLFAKLREAIPLDRRGGANCVKSASFGTSTSITYGGVTSGDLTCGDDPVSRELSRTVGVISRQLGLGRLPRH